jgi:enoyl-CoA hydratase
LESASAAALMSARGQAILTQFEYMPKPVIAAINGYALGGGCELLLACDIRIAAESARIGQPEINLGIIPGYGGTQRLPRLVGAGMAKYLIFSGEHISAAEAHQIGLVDMVVADDELQATAMQLAQKLAAKAPLALMMAKEAVNMATETGLESGLAFEAAQFGLVAATSDAREGTGAFLEKRQPHFEGR